MVVDGTFPVQGPGAWLPWQGLERVSVDQTLKNGCQIVEYLHRELLQSTSAAFGGSARSGTSCSVPPPHGASSPRVGPLFQPCDVTTCGVVHVWMSHLETAWPQSQILWWYLAGYLHIWRPLVQVRLTQTPNNVPLTRLAWKDSLGLGLYELFV